MREEKENRKEGKNTEEEEEPSTNATAPHYTTTCLEAETPVAPPLTIAP